MPNNESSWPVSPDMLADFIEFYREHPTFWENIAAIHSHGGSPEKRLRQTVEETAAKLQPSN